MSFVINESNMNIWRPYWIYANEQFIQANVTVFHVHLCSYNSHNSSLNHSNMSYDYVNMPIYLYMVAILDLCKLGYFPYGNFLELLVCCYDDKTELHCGKKTFCCNFFPILTLPGLYCSWNVQNIVIFFLRG
jgi:hypothetical protein